MTDREGGNGRERDGKNDCKDTNKLETVKRREKGRESGWESEIVEGRN